MNCCQFCFSPTKSFFALEGALNRLYFVCGRCDFYFRSHMREGSEELKEVKYFA